jgi:hypothetical protein
MHYLYELRAAETLEFGRESKQDLKRRMTLLAKAISKLLLSLQSVFVQPKGSFKRLCMQQVCEFY